MTVHVFVYGAVLRGEGRIYLVAMVLPKILAMIKSLNLTLWLMIKIFVDICDGYEIFKKKFVQKFKKTKGVYCRFFSARFVFAVWSDFSIIMII